MPIPAPAPSTDTRYLFGVAAADMAVTASVIDNTLKVVDGTVSAWTDATGGTQLDDLQDAAGAPIVEARAVRGQYAFFGPPGVTHLWVSVDGGERELLASAQAIADAAYYAGAAATSQQAAQAAADRAEEFGAPPVAYDTDGAPFLTDRVGQPGAGIDYDTDGVPYLIGA